MIHQGVVPLCCPVPCNPCIKTVRQTVPLIRHKKEEKTKRGKEEALWNRITFRCYARKLILVSLRADSSKEAFVKRILCFHKNIFLGCAPEALLLLFLFGCFRREMTLWIEFEL